MMMWMRTLRWIALFFLAVTVINYPNPFDPRSGQIVTFEGTSDTSTEAMLFLYDMSARLLFSRDPPLAAGTASRITWNGYTVDNQLAGSGLYLYRVVGKAGGTNLARGKVWIINK